jgi:hypothetical protein
MVTVVAQLRHYHPKENDETPKGNAWFFYIWGLEMGLDTPINRTLHGS